MKQQFRFLAFLFVGLLGIWGARQTDSSVEKNEVSGSTAISGQEPSAWEWLVSTPEEQGLDPQMLAELANLIREEERYPNLHALLIVRHGRLVVEEYFNNWKADQIHTLQSVTKSFTSALIGIAIARGEFKSVDEKVLDFFPDMKDIANMDERKKSMRLEDLLTMRSGTDFHERDAGSPYRQMMGLTKGWDRFYLDLKKGMTYVHNLRNFKEVMFMNLPRN